MNLIALTALIAATSSLAQPANLYFDDIELRFEVGRYGMPGYFLKSMDFDARDETSEISMQYMGHAKDMYSPRDRTDPTDLMPIFPNFGQCYAFNRDTASMTDEEIDQAGDSIVTKAPLWYSILEPLPVVDPDTRTLSGSFRMQLEYRDESRPWSATLEVPSENFDPRDFNQQQELSVSFGTFYVESAPIVPNW